MPVQNPRQNRPTEPKVIALAAVKPKLSAALPWQIGMALLAYSWISLIH